MRALPTRNNRLSILLYLARKTSDCWRTTPPSYIKWWSCIFRERAWPLEIRWSTMVAFTFQCLKMHSSVWKIEGRKTCFRRLGHSFIEFYKSAQISTNLYIKRPIYRRLQKNRPGFYHHYQASHGVATIQWIISRLSFNAFNNALHRCIKITISQLMILISL